MWPNPLFFFLSTALVYRAIPQEVTSAHPARGQIMTTYSNDDLHLVDRFSGSEHSAHLTVSPLGGTWLGLLITIT